MEYNEARNYLQSKAPFFIAMSHYLAPIESKDIETAATDGQYIYYNQEFFDKLTREEAAGVICHEILHCAYKHLWRIKDRQRTPWNAAADFAINPVITETFSLPKGVLLDSKYYGMDAEAIYDSFPKISVPMEGDGDGEGDSGDKEGKGSGSGNSKKSKGKQKSGTGNDKGGDGQKKQAWGEHHFWPSKKKDKKGKGKSKPKGGSNKSPRELEAAWDRMFSDLAKDYGKLPSSLKRVIEKKFYIPVLDWTSLVSNILSADNSDYSFSYPDRRFLGSGFILPDMYNVNKLKDVIFAYDTSGSISQQDLLSYYMETVSLFNNFTSFEGHIAVCDAQLHSFKPISSADSYDSFDFRGGGGTDFEPVFDKIQEEGLNPRALFYFTDTIGSFPRKDPGYDVFWLVPSYVGDTYPKEVPFGEVVKYIPKHQL